MAEISFNLSHQQGFNFSKDVQVPIGFITKLKFNGADVTADLDIIEPVESAKTSVVGVMTQVYWDAEITGAVQLCAQISTKNKQLFKQALLNDLKNTAVEFEFCVYDYDTTSEPQKYYECFHTGGAALKGSIQKQGPDLAVQIGDQPDMAVQQPENYALMISIVPEPIEQDLKVAVSSSAKFAKQWGVKAQ